MQWFNIIQCFIIVYCWLKIVEHNIPNIETINAACLAAMLSCAD